ncbi:MAG: universal stress protein [Haloglomus sp.]
MYERILFPTDGSDGADAALEHAVDLACTYDARLYVLYVADTNRDSVTVVEGDVVDALEAEGESVVAAAAQRARGRGVDTETDVLQGDPPDTILDYVDQRDIDLIVMPTRGRQGLDRYLLGSVTERVLRTASAPVLAVRMDGGE